jgi:LYR motif-containing protein 4
MTSSREIVQLYRQILRYAKHYPSKKRNSIIADIKEQFHEDKTLTDATRIDNALQHARIGLDELRQYAPEVMGASGEDGSWSINLRGNTIPLDQSTDVIKDRK